jgi:hypothetical protein
MVAHRDGRSPRPHGASPPGRASPERLAFALGCDGGAAVERVHVLAATGLASERTLGRVSGYSLTPEGSAALASELDAEGLHGDPGLTELYDRFCLVNERFLKVASDWQVRKHGPIEAPNDHADADYDQGVIDRLAEVHDRTRVLVGGMAQCSSRFAVYRARLDDCMRRVAGGDRTAFTAALSESYHTVWFELHQDLILTLGVERES